MKIFSGTSNLSLAEKVAQHLHISLSPLDMHIFPDGEKRIRVVDKVLGEDCIVVQPTSTPVDENYMELFLIVDALKRSGAKSVTAVIPYLGYQRQDHIFREGEAVSLSVVEKTLESVGVSSIIAFDLHSVKTPEIFHVPLYHLSALSLFAKKIEEIYGSTLYNTVLVTPDMGGVRRIKILSEMLNNTPYVEIVKNRDVITGEISADKIKGDIREKAVIVDDMISTGLTIKQACKLLKNKGVKEIYVFATHAVFSKNAKKVLEQCDVVKFFVTDTISVLEKNRFKKLEILSVSSLIAQKIRDIL